MNNAIRKCIEAEIELSDVRIEALIKIASEKNCRFEEVITEALDQFIERENK